MARLTGTLVMTGLQLCLLLSVSWALADTQQQLLDVTKKLERLEHEINAIKQHFIRLIPENGELYKENGVLTAENDMLALENERLYQENQRLVQHNTMMAQCGGPANSSKGPDYSPGVSLGLGRDCADLLLSQGHDQDGEYLIQPSGLGRPVKVWCDMTTDGGGWTVLLTRDKYLPLHQLFDLGWRQYKVGFGTADKEHWLGLEAMHRLSAACPHRLYLDVTNLQDGERRWGQWNGFKVDDELHQYRLSLGSRDPASSLGDPLEWHSGNNFTTSDRDNDRAQGNCADGRVGAWWYNNCADIYPTSAHGAAWEGQPRTLYWNSTSEEGNWVILSKLQMKIRPQNFPGPCAA